MLFTMNLWPHTVSLLLFRNLSFAFVVVRPRVQRGDLAECNQECDS